MAKKIVHRKVGDKGPKKKKFDIPTLLLSVIQFIFLLVLIFFVVKLNIIPFKYIVILILILILINLFSIFLVSRKKVIFKVFGYIISVFIILINAVGMYYASETNNFLNGAFGNAEDYYINTYYLVSLNNDQYNNIEDLNDEKIGYYESTPNIDEALNKLNEDFEFDNILYDDSTSALSALENNDVATVIMEKSYYSFLAEYDDNFNDTNYKVVYSFEVKIKMELEEVDSDTDIFNIYIGGTDFTNLYNDFNMIVTVNKKTHKILLTSTPRDFYVNVHGKGGKDLLGYAAVWGINTSKKTLEDLYGIKIDYYVKINTESLVGLVDTLGGVEFCSDKGFTSNHALVMGTYDDTNGKKLYVKKGCHTYKGIEILTIARERKAYPDGDRQRQKNCQQIMISIFNKMVSADTIVNYSSILNSVSNLYTTNIPKDLVTDFAKDVINNGAKWTFEQQSVTGSDSRGYVHFSNLQDYVMIPNQDSVASATANIKKVESGK